jgi:hypothetical protein
MHPGTTLAESTGSVGSLTLPHTPTPLPQHKLGTQDTFMIYKLEIREPYVKYVVGWRDKTRERGRNKTK